MSNYKQTSEFKKLRGGTGIGLKAFEEGSIEAFTINNIGDYGRRRKTTQFISKVCYSSKKPSSGLTFSAVDNILDSCLGQNIQVAIEKLTNRFSHKGFRPIHIKHFVTDINWEKVELVRHGGYNGGYFLNAENILCYLNHDDKVYKDKTYRDVPTDWKAKRNLEKLQDKKEALEKGPKTLGEKLSRKAKKVAERKAWLASKEPNLEMGETILRKQSLLFKAKYTVALNDLLKDVE